MKLHDPDLSPENPGISTARNWGVFHFGGEIFPCATKFRPQDAMWMKRVGFWIFFLALSLVSSGEEGLLEQEDQCVYVKDGLFLKVAILDDPRAFLAEWTKPSRSNTPAIMTRTSFHRGEVIFPAIMYSTNALTPEGKADISYTLLFRRPDGSIYEHLKDLTVVNGAPPKGVGLCKARAGLKIEDADPFGEYTLKVTTTDKIKGVTVEMLFKFSVIDPAAKPPDPVVPEADASSVEDPIHPDSSPTRLPIPQGRVRSFSGDTW